MTDDELEAIKERANKATPGPWELGSHRRQVIFSEKYGRIAQTQGHSQADQRMIDDADFIAHAREDIPALLAEIERLRANS